MDRQRRTSGSTSSTGSSYTRSSSSGGMQSYDDRSGPGGGGGGGPRGYSSGRGSSGGGRGGGGRPRQNDRRGGGGRGGGNGRGHPGMMGGNRPPPTILMRDKRQESPSAMAPGAVSIMQRESSAGSHIPTSTTGLPMRAVTSPALLPTPLESGGQHQPPSSLPQVREGFVCVCVREREREKWGEKGSFSADSTRFLHQYHRSYPEGESAIHSTIFYTPIDTNDIIS